MTRWNIRLAIALLVLATITSSLAAQQHGPRKPNRIQRRVRDSVVVAYTRLGLGSAQFQTTGGKGPDALERLAGKQVRSVDPGEAGGTGGPQLVGQCGEPPKPPCLPHINLISGLPSQLSRPPEGGPFTQTIAVSNNGSVAGTFEFFCTVPDQITCDASPAWIDLGPSESVVVTYTYSTRGLGRFRLSAIVMAEPGPVVDVTDIDYLDVAGTSILTLVYPFAGGTYTNLDSMTALFAHPTQAVDTATLKMWIGGTNFTSSIRSRNIPGQGASARLKPNAPPSGVQDWVSYGCTATGRCDTVHATVTFPDPDAVWALDDSVAADEVAGGFGGVGPLPIPPIALRGCPLVPHAPDLVINEPFTLIAGQSQGRAFVASYITTNGLLQLRFTHVVPEDKTKTCTNGYSYLPPTSFNYSWWPTEFYPTLFDHYAYSDSGGLAQAEYEGRAEESYAAWDGDETGAVFDRRIRGPNQGGGLVRRRGWLYERLVATLAPTGHAVMSIADAIPDPGPIDLATFNVTLNGTTIISGGNAIYAGVQMVSRWAGGETWTIPVNAAILNRLDSTNHALNNGGWNELVASISAPDPELEVKTTSMRTRWVQGPESLGNGGGEITPLRDFSRSLTAECPAFGVFQCGSLFLAQGITGFVSRDRERGLALVYRSGAARIPTQLPFRYEIDRYHTIPDSFWVRTMIDDVYVGDTLRYAGTKGTPGGMNVLPLSPGASADRVMGAEVPAHPTAEVAIRNVKVVLTRFYPGLTSDTTFTTNVVQLYATSASATRFGPGWVLGQQPRLHSGLMWGTDSAKVWASGDGSWIVFRKIGGAWRAPAGVTTKLRVLTATDDRAKYILVLDDGTRVGFLADTGMNRGRIAWTADLLSNRTRFLYHSVAPNELVSINDPTGAKFLFTYDNIGSGAIDTVVTGIALMPAGGGTNRTVTNLVYDATTRRLTKAISWRSASQADTVTYGYATTATGAFVTSVTDPRSTSGNVIDTRFAYDTSVWSPVLSETPVARNGQRYSQRFRDLWRRSVPRAGIGRRRNGAIGGLERLLTYEQFRGTSIDTRGKATDFQADPFGAATKVWRLSGETVASAGGGGMYIPGSVADDITTITRDAAGRVTRIVRIADVSDSVLYVHDTIYNRPKYVIRPTLRVDSLLDTLHLLDTLRFSYDSAVVADSLRVCTRTRVSVGALGDSTKITYGTSGAGKCLPVAVRNPGGDSTRFIYGTMSANQISTIRPIVIIDAAGVRDSAWFDPRTWNTNTTSGHGSRGEAFFEPFGRVDSSMAGIRGQAWTTTRNVLDWMGRVTHSKTGRGALAPTTRTTYLHGGLVSEVRVFHSDDADITAPAGTDSQVTRYYYDRLGLLDSTLAPGARTLVKEGRRQSNLHTAAGDVVLEYPGNGLWIRRIPDRSGRIRLIEQAPTSYTTSVDGERYAAASVLDSSSVGIFSLSAGKHLSTGSLTDLTYNGFGLLATSTAIDLHSLNQINTSLVYRPNGQVTTELKKFTDSSDVGFDVTRQVRYNRRGQRTWVREVVSGLGGGTIAGDPVNYRKYTYDSLTGRLQQMEAQTAASTTAAPFTFARLNLTYDAFGRVTRKVVRVFEPSGTNDSLVTTVAYSAATGRATNQTTTRGGSIWYAQATADADYNALGDLTSMSVTLPGGGGSETEAFSYDTTGLRRLRGAFRVGPHAYSTGYTYDLFGNRTSEDAPVPMGLGCVSSSSANSFGPDSRLVRRYWAGAGAGCEVSYQVDQLGNRLGELFYVDDSLDLTRTQRMSYTAANQLYFSLTNTATEVPNRYDANWHYYDADGMRAHTETKRVDTWFPELSGTDGTYYSYDGSDVAFTVRRLGSGTSFQVWQRYMTGGIDNALAVRVVDAGGNTRSIAMVNDHQGSPVGGMRPDGIAELNGGLWSREPFGAAYGMTDNSTVNAGGGFTGASTPNQGGGFTYMRNRWYDPATGRFLTQDPIGLAGGVNLYAYAGNNPVAFSDPWGLERIEASAAVWAKLNQCAAASAACAQLIRQADADPRVIAIEEVGPNGQLSGKNLSGSTGIDYLTGLDPENGGDTRMAVSAGVKIKPSDFAQNSKQEGGIPITWNTVIAHELGHVLGTFQGADQKPLAPWLECGESCTKRFFENPVRTDLGLPQRQ